MSGLARTIADLAARARSGVGEARPSPLEAVGDFGANPGALKMWVHAPDDPAPSPPLVVVLHGCGQTAAGYARDSGWLTLADRYGFVLLCPEQARANNANACFNWFVPQDIGRDGGEAASIAQMVRHAVATRGVDPGRVFVTGLSAGGAIAAAMLAAYPELFAGGAVVAGLPYGAAARLPEALSAMKAVPALSAGAWGDKVRRASPSARRWPRIAIWHGDADATVAPGAADALIAQWIDVHGLTRARSETSTEARHRRTTWRNDQGEILVEDHRITGLGHGVPIAAGGDDGCGAPAPWVLEAGVSSSLEMARAWGLADRRRDARVAKSGPAPSASMPAAPRGTGGPVDVGAVISKALKSAGLLS